MRIFVAILAVLFSTNAFAECSLEQANASIHGYAKERHGKSNNIYMGPVLPVYQDSKLVAYEAAVALVDKTGKYKDKDGQDMGLSDIGKISAEPQYCIPRTISVSADLLR